MKLSKYQPVQLSVVVSALIVPLMASTALAQEEVIEEIVVSGSAGQSLARQLDLKRNTTEFADGLVAVELGKFPDNNLGEALARIPGVVVDRNSGSSQSGVIGEGGTINVRGLGPDFTRTEINGVTATTPGQERGFGFNILASELFQSVVVQKSLKASDNEGGLAGTVTLNTYRPLSFDETTIVITPQVTYSDLADEVSPAATFIYSGKSADGNFGASLVLNYSQTDPTELSVDVSNWDFLSDSMRGNFDLLTPAEQAQYADTRIPRDPKFLANTREQTRINVALTLEAQVNDRFNVTFDNIFADVDHTGRQTRNDFPIEGFPATFLPPDIQVDGNQFVSGTFPAVSHYQRILDYEYDVQSSLYQGILTGTWDATDNLRVTPRLGYSTAEEEFGWSDFDVRTGPTDIFYQFDGQFTTPDPANGLGDPAAFATLNRVRDRPDTDKDDELSFDLDFDLNIDRGIWTSFEFGLRYSDRQKEFLDYQGSADLSTFTGNVTDFIRTGSFDFDGAPAGIPGQILTLDTVGLRAAVAPFSVDTIPTSNYVITEETLAGYGMINFDTDTVAGNFGVRVVKTDQNSSGVQTVGGVQFPASFDDDYTEVLPSLNAKWDINDDVVGRFAVYRSLTRPRLSDVSPGRTLDNFDGGSGTAGNPSLDPFTAWNYDIGLEWYFAEESAVTAAYFYKDLDGLIDRTVEEVTVVDPGSGQTITLNVTRPINGESASVSGFEIGLQSPFSYGTGFLSNAGFAVNATFTDSEANFSDAQDIRNSSLPGLSDSSYNAIVYYEVETFETRLAYNWRSEYLDRVSGSGGNPISRDAYGQLDLSGTVNFNDNWSATLDVINLTNEQPEDYTFQDHRFVAGTTHFGRRFLLSVSYRMQ